MAGDNAAPAKGGKSILKEVPKWAWIAGGAAVVVVIVLRLRSSSAATTAAVATPVSPPTVDPASIPATSGAGSTDSSVSTIVSVPPDYTSQLAGLEASLAAIQALLQQQVMSQPFHNTIHPVPVTPGSPPVPGTPGSPPVPGTPGSPNPPSYPGGTGDYAGGSNPAYVGPLPGSPAFGLPLSGWNPLYNGSFGGPSMPVPSSPPVTFQSPPAPAQVTGVVPVGHPLPPTHPGYPSVPHPQNRVAVSH